MWIAYQKTEFWSCDHEGIAAAPTLGAGYKSISFSIAMKGHWRNGHNSRTTYIHTYLYFSNFVKKISIKLITVPVHFYTSFFFCFLKCKWTLFHCQHFFLFCTCIFSCGLCRVGCYHWKSKLELLNLNKCILIKSKHFKREVWQNQISFMVNVGENIQLHLLVYLWK